MKTIKTNCWNCSDERNHSILFSIKKKDELDDMNHYKVVECLGCESVSFLHINEFKIGKKTHEIHYNYPDNEPYEEGFFLASEEQDILPGSIRDVYVEVQNAFNSHSPILSGIGLRTLVEATCLNKKINGRNLQQKITNLKAQDLITQHQLLILDKLREIGNFSAHEIKTIPLSKLETAVHIINHLLKELYILPKLNKRLKKI